MPAHANSASSASVVVTSSLNLSTTPTYLLTSRSAEKQTCTYCYCTHADYLYIVDMTKSTILAALFVLLLAPYGARPQGVPECSCSPKAFQFFISSLDLDCEKNDIVNNSGISEATTACFIELGIPPDPPILGIEEEGKTPEELNPDFKVNNITSIIFKEFDKDNNTISETKQNYRGTPLENGNQINFFSISSTLSTMSSLEDQIGRVPYRVEIRLFGYNEEGELISNIIRWSYDMSCGSDPIQTGDTIGRITIVSIDSNMICLLSCNQLC